MKGSSFRDILAEFLEEKLEIPTPQTTANQQFHAEPAPLLQWKSENLRQTASAAGFAAKSGYPPPPPRKTMPVREEKPARPVAAERIFKREQLSSEAQMAAIVLIAAGAHELETGISRERLKKGHRRLIKALHPDRNQGADKNAFLKVQGCYEILSDELASLTLSGSACDSGSASAQGSQRQDAA